MASHPYSIEEPKLIESDPAKDSVLKRVQKLRGD